MMVLAQDEGLYEASRMIPAVLIALVLLVLSSGVLALAIKWRPRSVARSAPIAAAIAGLVAVVISITPGLMMVESSVNDSVCGPAFNPWRPFQPLACDGALDSRLAVSAALVGVGVLCAIGALVVGWQQRSDAADAVDGAAQS